VDQLGELSLGAEAPVEGERQRERVRDDVPRE
jgi:hypothetical protein